MSDESPGTRAPAPGRMLGRYRLEALLGRGGMAEVYQAADTKLARTVAVKVILPSFAAEEHFLERFLREARMVASLEHPNILPVYDFGEENGVPFLVMPWLPGGALRERLKAGKVSLAQAASWIAQLSSALDAAHDAGVLHRDVKPANVLIGKDDRLFLADFGIAKMLESQSGLTATGIVVGTPIYMAPEQAQGHPASRATDRYALAVVAYEILAGRPPFEGDSALALMHQHVSTPPPALSTRVGGLPAGLDTVLLQALAKDPAARPPTCRAFAEAVAAFAPAGAAPPPGSSGWGTIPFPNTAPTVISTPDPRAASRASATAPFTSRATAPQVRISGPRPGLTSDQTVVTGPRSPWRRAGLVGAAAAVALAAAWWVMAHRFAQAPVPLAAAPTPSAAPAPTAPPAPIAVVETTAAPASSSTSPAEKPEALVQRLSEENKRIARLETRLRDAEADAQQARAAQAAQAVRPAPTPVFSPTPEPAPSPELAGGTEERGHPLEAARQRLEVARNPEHRLSKDDFLFALSESERVVRKQPLNPEARFLEQYSRGGLAYVAGNDGIASKILVDAFTSADHTRRAARPIENLLRRPDGSFAEPNGWELALAYGDARGEAMGLIERELSIHPRSMRALKARAYLRRMQGMAAR